MNVRRSVFWLIAVLLVGLGLLPLVDIFAQRLFVNGQFSLALFHNLFASAQTRHLLITSLSLAGLVTLLSLLLGLPLGILLGKSDVPGRPLLITLSTVPLLIPPYVYAVAWFHLLGRQGWVSRWFAGGDWKAGSDFLFSLGCCVWILFACYMPILMLLTIAFIRSVNPRLEEAAQVMGVSWTKRITGIVMPLVRRDLGVAWLVAYIFCLRDTGISMMVYPPGTDLLTVRIFTLMANGEPAMIAALCVLLVVVSLIPLVAPAGPFRIGIGFYPWRQQPDDPFTQDQPNNSFPGPPDNPYFNPLDSNAVLSLSPVAYLTYDAGSVSAGIVAEYFGYHRGPESQRLQMDRASFASSDIISTDGGVYVKYSNTRFFLQCGIGLDQQNNRVSPVSERDLFRNT